MKCYITSNKKAIKYASIFCSIGIVFLMFSYFYEIYKTKDYIKTVAIITANVEDIDYNPDNSSTTIYKYVEVRYGNYTNKYRVWTFFMKDKGSTTTIYYSSNNPYLIRDKFKMTTSILGIIFFSIFLLTINFCKKHSSSEYLDNINKKPCIR